jgi:hypothetical protein
MKVIFAYIATALTVIAYVPYIKAILGKKVTPNRVTWLVLFLLGTISAIAYYKVGAKLTLWVAIANVIGPLVTFLLSIKFGEGWAKSELKYLLGSLFAITLWIVTGSPLWGLIFNLGADFFGFIPTIIKSYYRPKSEDVFTWFLFVLGGCFNLLAIEAWDFQIAVYPIYIVAAESIVLFLLMRDKLIKHAKIHG